MKKKVILAVDTSTWQLSMCIYKDGKFYSKSLPTEDHSDSLINCLDELLKKSGLKLTQINYIGVNIGPGSFTGLRVGLSFVKTLGLSLNLKVICVNSFDIIFYEFMKKYEPKIDSKIVVLFPSVKNEFYFCEYLFDDTDLKVLNIGYIKIQDIKKQFSSKCKLLIPENLKGTSFYEDKFDVCKVEFNASTTIIRIFIEGKKCMYRLLKPKELFPLYIRHTYY